MSQYSLQNLVDIFGSKASYSHCAAERRNEKEIEDIETRDSFELYYLQNYSIWMDIDILAKSILNGYSLDEQLRDA